MTNQQLKSFVKHVILASKKQEERKSTRDSLKKQIRKVRSIASSPRIKKEELKSSMKELEQRLNKIVEKEGTLVEAAERDYRASEEIKEKIRTLENNLAELGSRDSTIIHMLNDQIRRLEQELDVSEKRRIEEVHFSRERIEDVRKAISELKERIRTVVETKMERDKRVVKLEQRMKQESEENRDDIRHIEEELSKIKEKEEKPSFFDKLRAMFKKKPKSLVTPEEKKLFREEITEEKEPLPLPEFSPKPIIRKRPVVKHDILFEEPRAKPGIPKDDMEELNLPPPPRAPLIRPGKKQGFIDKIREILNRRV